MLYNCSFFLRWKRCHSILHIRCKYKHYFYIGTTQKDLTFFVECAKAGPRPVGVPAPNYSPGICTCQVNTVYLRCYYRLLLVFWKTSIIPPFLIAPAEGSDIFLALFRFHWEPPQSLETCPDAIGKEGLYHSLKRVRAFCLKGCWPFA